MAKARSVSTGQAGNEVPQPRPLVSRVLGSLAYPRAETDSRAIIYPDKQVDGTEPDPRTIRNYFYSDPTYIKRALLISRVAHLVPPYDDERRRGIASL